MNFLKAPFIILDGAFFMPVDLSATITLNYSITNKAYE